MDTMEHLEDLGNLLIKNYDPEKMDLYQWLNTFEYTLGLLNISGDKKVEFLLKFMEPLPLLEIKNKVAPDDPLNLSYKELLYILGEMYGLSHAEYALNYRFYIRDQIIGENAQQYLNNLMKILCKSSPCLRNVEVLMKRFINGLADPVIREELSNKTDLTLENAVATATLLELKHNPDN